MKYIKRPIPSPRYIASTDLEWLFGRVIMAKRFKWDGRKFYADPEGDLYEVRVDIADAHARAWNSVVAPGREIEGAKQLIKLHVFYRLPRGAKETVLQVTYAEVVAQIPEKILRENERICCEVAHTQDIVYRSGEEKYLQAILTVHSY